MRLPLISAAFRALPLVTTTAALLLALAPAAHAGVGGPAAVACSGSINTIANDGYSGQCQGPVAGAFSTAAVSFGSSSFVFLGASNDASGVFAADPAGAAWGTLALSNLATGSLGASSFVLGLQGSASYSLYLFDGSTAPVALLDFDSAGLLGANGLAATQVQYAALFVTSAVPEPTSLGLMAAGMALLGLLSLRLRRRPARQARR